MRKLFALCLLAAASHAFACGCSKPHTPDEVRHFTHIFKGQVQSVRTSYEHGFVQQTVGFLVIEPIKGPASAWLEVSFGGPTSCDLETPDFKLGQVYLISDHDRGTVWHTWPPTQQHTGNYCSLRERVSDA